MRNLPDDDRRTDYNRTDTDASAGWRAEYRYQEVDSRRQLRADGGDRPNGCHCWEVTGALPCFACYDDGFKTPNPEEPALKADTGGESGSDTARRAEVATDGGTSFPATTTLADTLGVRVDHLIRFVETHPNPTAAVVLGWAYETGELEATPDELRQETREWLLENGHIDDVDDPAEAAPGGSQ